MEKGPTREEIVRSDFPVTRRGYDREVVDAHLGRLADAFGELQRRAASPLAETAGEKVSTIIGLVEQSAAEILEAADRKAAEILSDAAAEATERAGRAQEALERLTTQTESLREEVGEMGRRLERDLRKATTQRPASAPVEAQITLRQGSSDRGDLLNELFSSTARDPEAGDGL